MYRRGRKCGKGGLGHGFLFLLVLVFAGGLIAKGADVNQPPAMDVDRALANVRECMVRSPAPWPEPWTQEYLDTRRS